MSGSNSVQFVRIYNQSPLKEICASVLKQHYISNVHRAFDKYFAKELSPSERSYLFDLLVTGPSKEELMPVLMYTLSMLSSTFLPISSDVIGNYNT